MTTHSIESTSWMCVCAGVCVCVSGVGGKGCVNWGCPGAGTGTFKGGGLRGGERTPPASSQSLCLPATCPLLPPGGRELAQSRLALQATAPQPLQEVTVCGPPNSAERS